MKVVWSTTARQDLVHIRPYINRFHPSAARGVANRILAAVEEISRHPYLGTGTSLVAVRRLVVSGAPYVIYYKLSAERIEILEVFDGRRAVPRTMAADE
ncbi:MULTISPECIES: type II toxin-antitoxin system RelE/ParE family toxin [unclassified Rhizobium]|uniref:type II toxin-antitoxin system RelE/ParE family toxin n=1 Tax=unclassified Rhizobium TaxID=2613769 RepID=UPI0009EC24EE